MLLPGQSDHKKLFFVIKKNYSYVIWPDCMEKPRFLAGWLAGWPDACSTAIPSIDPSYAAARPI
jgi:hypothetical protein